MILMILGMASSWLYGTNMAEIEAAAAEVRGGTEKVPCRWSEKRSSRSVCQWVDGNMFQREYHGIYNLTILKQSLIIEIHWINIGLSEHGDNPFQMAIYSWR